MDIKAPLEKYSQISGVDVNIEYIKQSIDMILNSNIDYEFRTTVLKTQLIFDDFVEIAKILNGAKKYYLQKFIPSKIYDQKLMSEKTYDDTDFDSICNFLKRYIAFVAYR